MQSARAKARAKAFKAVAITAASMGTPSETARNRARKEAKIKAKVIKVIKEKVKARAKEAVIKERAGLVESLAIQNTIVRRWVIKEEEKEAGDTKAKAMSGLQNGTRGHIIKERKRCSLVIKRHPK